MSTTYTTIQGDTWDLIAYKLYGSEKYMKNLIEANWPLLEVLVFSSGTVINVPDHSGRQRYRRTVLEKQRRQ